MDPGPGTGPWPSQQGSLLPAVGPVDPVATGEWPATDWPTGEWPRRDELPRPRSASGQFTAEQFMGEARAVPRGERRAGQAAPVKSSVDWSRIRRHDDNRPEPGPQPAAALLPPPAGPRVPAGPQAPVGPAPTIGHEHRPDAMPRLLAAARPDGEPAGLEEHLRTLGPLPSGDPVTTLRLVAESGLRGRGGAGFPVGAKMRAVVDAEGRAMVVVNGTAADPLGEKDTFLLTHLPHLILDGAQVAAEAVAARQIVVYVVEGPGAFRVMEQALAERRRARHDVVPMKLIAAPDRYVAGEASAVANALSGGPALPTFTPPHMAERGVRGRPTLVQNVETLANLALLARHGAWWFRSVGTDAEPGSILVTARGAVRQPVVTEVPGGTTVDQVVQEAGGLAEPVSGLLIGGCAGRWLPPDTALHAPLSHAGLAAAGGALGVGSVIIMPERACGLAETARLVRYLADEVAGQCGSCLNGLPAIAETLTALAECQADRGTVRRLFRWCGMVPGRGACRHPDATAALVASTLTVFTEDIDRHLDGWCGRPARGVLPVPEGGRRPGGRATR